MNNAKEHRSDKFVKTVLIHCSIYAEGAACIWPFRGTGFWVAIGSYIFMCIV